MTDRRRRIEARANELDTSAAALDRYAYRMIGTGAPVEEMLEGAAALRILAGNYRRTSTLGDMLAQRAPRMAGE